MEPVATYANLACTDGQAARRWFELLFGRAPDAEPMDGLIEWHFGDAAGLQVLVEPRKAGHGTAVFFVSDLEAERDRLEKGGATPGAIEDGGVRLLRLADPDGNLVVLVQAPS